MWAAVVLAILAPAAAFAHPEFDPYVTDLVVAGQCDSTVVGQVQVWNDDTNVYVTYVITDPNYTLSSLNLSGKKVLTDIPRDRRYGGFDTNLFEYKATVGADVSTYTFTVPLGEWKTNDLVYLAAQAGVKKEVVWRYGKWCAHHNQNCQIHHHSNHHGGWGQHGKCNKSSMYNKCWGGSWNWGWNYDGKCGNNNNDDNDNDGKCTCNCNHGGKEIVTYQCAKAWGKGTRIQRCKEDMYFMYVIEGTTTVHWPSEENRRITIGFEDKPLYYTNPPADWDYNDWIGDIEVSAKLFGNDEEGYNYMSEISFDFFRMVRLAGATHRWRLGADVFQVSGTYEVKLNGEVVETGVYDPSVGLDVLLLESGDATETNATVTIKFDELTPYVLPEFDQNTFHGEGLFFDPYLIRNVKGQYPEEEIHTGDIRMLVVPIDWEWPNEGQSIWLKYPKIQPAVWLGSSWQAPVFVPFWWEN
jgi:hypothetical protein